jgi:maltose O-acetyltransferase
MKLAVSGRLSRAVADRRGELAGAARRAAAAASSRARPVGAADPDGVLGYDCPMGEMRDRMLRGELYIADDADNDAEFGRVQELLARFNATRPDAVAERDELLRRTLRHVGEDVVVRPPFFCEYGAVSIGDRTFVNVDAVMLDVAPISIGAACQIATRVQLLTATHPIDPEPRRIGWEYAEPITIADNVWLGGGVIVCPGVTIGQDTVVGAGAVVTPDLPPGVVAAGVPARVLREIGERDRVEVPPVSGR